MLPMFVGIMDQTIVATALPAIAASLGEVDRIAWIVVSYLIATATIAPVYGRLGDAFGRRRMMFVALAVAIAGSTVSAVSNSIEMLIVGRLIQGLGGGGLLSLSHALIGQSVPPVDRARYQGFLATVAVMASVVGPVVGGFLTEHFGWRSIFLLNIPLCVLAMTLVLRLPQRSTPFERFRFDFPGLLLLAVFVSSLLIFVEEVKHLEATTYVVALAAVAIVSVALLYLREKKASNPLLPIPLLTKPNIWRCDLMALTHGGLFVAIISLLPLYLSAVRGLSASEIGLFMLPMTAMIGIGSSITGQLVARTGRTMIFPTVGLSVTTVVLVVLAYVINDLGIVGLSWFLGILSLFLGSVMAVVQVTILSEAGQYLGTATASIQLSRSLGAAAGTAIASAVLFAVIAMTGTEVSRELLALLQGSEEALASLSDGAEAVIRGNVATAFQAVFLTTAVYSAITLVLAWSMPRRTL
jgi:EmrB/QacA subfamily drug resistance transporter